MARPIDEKIVVMKLDNSDFKQKAAETTGIFGTLRNALNKIPGVNLGKTTQELNAISNAANGTNLNGLANSVQTISSRFSTLGVIATTALVNITNRAVNAGVSIVKSLTLDQVTSGFNEYETKIKAIGTVLSNTQWAGTNLNDVNAALADLNNYADKTIYNFGQMTENIGRFTAAGVKLDDATVAIKGLSNLAAASGSDVNQLNMAMYQMSQALAAGKLNLMDWNSMVNAGMGGKKTQDALVATARAMGKNVDLSDGFRNSIQQGWLTSEVFLKTLKKFGKDKSMTEAATSVRTFTGFWDALKESIGSGWATTFELIFGDFKQATTFWTGLSNAVGGWFSETTKARNNLIKGIADSGGIQNIFTGIQNAVKPIGQTFTAIGNGFRRAFPPKSAFEIAQLTERFKDFTKGLTMSNDSVNKLTIVFHGVFSIFSIVWQIVSKLGKAFLKLIPSGTGNGVLDLLSKISLLVIGFDNSLKAGNALTKGIDRLGNVLSAVGNGIKKAVTSFHDFSKSLTDNVGKAIDWLKTKLAPVGKFLKDTFGGIDGADILGAGTLIGIGIVVKKIAKLFQGFHGTFDSFKDMFKSIGEGIGGTFSDLGDALKAFTQQVKYNNLLKIAIAVGILAVSLKTLEGIKTEDITKGITALATSLGVMMAGLAIIDKFNMIGGMRASITIIALATAVDIMAVALKKISDLNPQQLITGIGGLVGATAALAGAIIAISKWGGKIKVGSLQLIALAGAIFILAGAIKTMSSIDTGGLVKGVVALGVIFGELAIFLNVADRTKLRISSALGLIAVAGAVQMMASAIQRIGGIDVGNLIKGLTTIAAILGEIVIFSKLVSGFSLLAAGPGLLLIAASINALVIPITLLGNMSWEELAKGLGAMAIALAAVAGVAMLASGTIGGAIAITAMAFAMNLLLIPMAAFSAMSWEGLIKGFVGMAGGILLLAGAALLLSPAVVPMLAFGAALTLMGVAMLAIGAGIGLFATGLATLATLTAASVAAIVAAIGLLLKGFAELIPAVVDFVVKLGLALINGIVTLVPPLANAIAMLIVSLLQTITRYLPQFIESGVTLILQLLAGMGMAIPALINGAIQFMTRLISGLAKGIRDNGPRLIGALMGLIGEIVILVIEAGASIINAVLGWIPGVKSATASIGRVATIYIRDNFKAADVGSQKGKDFASSLSSKTGDARSAGSRVGKAGRDGANSTDLNSVGNRKGSDFASGLGGKSGSAKSSGRALANGGKLGASSVSLSSTGSNFGQGFVNGISSKVGSVIQAAKNLAINAKNTVASWLHIHSPSKVAFALGGFFGEGMGLGIDNKVKRVGNSAKNMALTAVNSLNQFLDGFNLPTDNNEIHFKAVVDYDQLDTNKFGKLSPLSILPNTSITSSMVPSMTKSGSNPDINAISNDNTEILKRQEQQIGFMQKQIDLLSVISNKDTSVYLDPKEVYNSNKKIQNEQTNLRNIFKGVTSL